MPVFWFVRGGILILSGTLDAYQVSVAQDTSIPLARSALGLVLLLAAAYSIRKGIAESNRNGP